MGAEAMTRTLVLCLLLTACRIASQDPLKADWVHFNDVSKVDRKTIWRDGHEAWLTMVYGDTAETRLKVDCRAAEWGDDQGNHGGFGLLRLPPPPNMISWNVYRLACQPQTR
jgi:hypothetical protein